MRIRVLACVLLAAIAPAAPAMAGTAADAIVGKWYTEDNESQVVIVKKTNGDGTEKYSGSIVWLDEPLYEKDHEEAGKPKHDLNNPDASRRNDPIIGLRILKNFVYDADDKTWDSGTIYDPDRGKTYKCTMRLSEDGQKLAVRGYIGIPVFGRSTEWVRVPETVKTE